MGHSAHAGRRPRGVREASRSLAGLRPTRAEKDVLRASGIWGLGIPTRARFRARFRSVTQRTRAFTPAGIE